MPVGSRRTDAGHARGIGEGEASRALFSDQVERGLQQCFLEIAVVIAALGAALLFLAPVHVMHFYMNRRRETSRNKTKWLTAGDRQDRHYLDGFAGENRKMRVIFEEFCRR